MQTIASLANRLDMSPEKAVEVLRELRYDVESVDTEISDEQCDILMDVDEDSSALPRMLKEIEKKEEQARKRNERLQKAAKKAAAKKKAEKEKAEAAKAKAKPKPKKTAKSKAEEPEIKAEVIEEPAPIAEVIPDDAPKAAVIQETDAEKPAAAEIVDEKAPEAGTAATPPVAEILPPEAPPETPSEVAEGDAESATETQPEAAAEAPKEDAPAETAPSDEAAVAAPPESPTPSPETPAEESAAPAAETEAKTESVAEPADASAQAPGTDDTESAAIAEQQVAEILPPAEEKPKAQAKERSGPAEGTLARADQLQEDEERRKRQQELRDKERREKAQQEKEKAKDERPLPVPDPAVVAEVIRKAKEKEAAKLRAKTRKPVKSGDAPAKRGGRAKGPDQPVEPAASIPVEDLGKGGRGGKAQKKRKKKQEQTREMDELLRRNAAAAVRGIQAGGAKPGASRRRRKQQRNADSPMPEETITGGTIEVDEAMTVEQLAEAMEQEVNDLILDLMDLNIMANKNQTLEMEVIRQVAERYNFEVRAVIPEEEELLSEAPDKPEDLTPRPPVITVMGHVDHGKTSFLDVVREANVADGEAGGITQHIAAYTVEMTDGKVTFLDTPGHAAFTHMRSRGAQATDIVVLVVAADDGVKPQTIEAIDHAKAAEVPIVVAVNKCDKPEAQPDRVRQELVQYDLVDEAWGGKTIIRNISCHTREGIQDLLEMLVLQAELLELKANANKDARGVIIEAELTTGLGPVAWVLVQSGTLKVGDIFLSGETHGRVRTLTNSRGENIQEAGPSMPVVVTGFNATAEAGDQFIALQDERMARNIAEKRAAVNRQKRGAASQHMTLEDFHARMMGLDRKVLNIIFKADVQGSADVLSSSAMRFGNEEVSINVVHSGVGAINESDILLASASDAVVIGFHVTANPKAEALAEREGVEIRTYLVIYEAMDDLRKALEGMLAPDLNEVVTGRAEVRAVFRSSSLGNIAGCYQLEGETERGSQARLLRKGEVVNESRIATVKREKDDVRSVSAGYECGLRLDRFDAFEEGDIIETFRVESVPKQLSS